MQVDCAASVQQAPVIKFSGKPLLGSEHPQFVQLCNENWVLSPHSLGLGEAQQKVDNFIRDPEDSRSPKKGRFGTLQQAQPRPSDAPAAKTAPHPPLLVPRPPDCLFLWSLSPSIRVGDTVHPAGVRSPSVSTSAMACRGWPGVLALRSALGRGGATGRAPAEGRFGLGAVAPPQASGTPGHTATQTQRRGEQRRRATAAATARDLLEARPVRRQVELGLRHTTA